METLGREVTDFNDVILTKMLRDVAKLFRYPTINVS